MASYWDMSRHPKAWSILFDPAAEAEGDRPDTWEPLTDWDMDFTDGAFDVWFGGRHGA